MKPSAILLCGGESRRMGRSKALLPFGPEALLQRMVRLLSEAVDRIVVVAAVEQDLPSLPATVVIARDPQPGLGPLQGLAAGLHALPEDVELVYVTGTDSPFFQREWIGCLVALSRGNDLVIPNVEGRRHPLASLYRRAGTLNAAERLLKGGRRRLLDLVDVLTTLEVDAEALREADPSFQTLRNLNTLDDYASALREFENAEESAEPFREDLG